MRDNIPVTSVVFHNRQWGAEKKNQVDFYNDRLSWHELENPSFAAIAHAMGAEGITVDRPDQVGDALRQATALEQADRARDHGVTQEVGVYLFRRDALKKPKRLLKKYEAYTVA